MYRKYNLLLILEVQNFPFSKEITFSADILYSVYSLFYIESVKLKF